jgi:hypothetical protein
MRVPLHSGTLTRQSTGLTEPHRDLIRVLAEIAVADYLRETDAETLEKADCKEATP